MPYHGSTATDVAACACVFAACLAVGTSWSLSGEWGVKVAGGDADGVFGPTCSGPIGGEHELVKITRYKVQSILFGPTCSGPIGGEHKVVQSINYKVYSTKYTVRPHLQRSHRR